MVKYIPPFVMWPEEPTTSYTILPRRTNLVSDLGCIAGCKSDWVERFGSRFCPTASNGTLTAKKKFWHLMILPVCSETSPVFSETSCGR